MQVGHFACDYDMPVFSQNLNHIREFLRDPVRGFVENLGARRDLYRLERSPSLSSASAEEIR
jgi:hypothetical protein